MMLRRFALKSFGGIVVVALTICVSTLGQNRAAPVDPGVRGGPAGGGAPLKGLTADETVFFQDGHFSSNMDAVDLKNKRPMIPLQIDPPEHKKFRKLLDPLFAPRKMALLDDEVSALVNQLIDGFIDRGEVDFAKEFSIPFPSQVFLTLLGLPLEELDRFLTMKDGIIRPDHVTGKLYGSPEAADYQQMIADSVYDYFNEILDQREVERRDDLLSHFLDAEMEGDRLTREDILDICFLFLIAGLDTVTATLDCMFAFLAQHPEQQRQLVEDPALIPNAIEELLRWETPVMGIARVAVADTELAGCPIHAGDQVMVMIGSANTDEAEFPDGEVVRFDREVNPHIAFGGGITAVSVRTWRASSYGSRCESGTSGYASTRSSPATRSPTRRAYAPSTTFPCASPCRRSRFGAAPPAVGHVLGPAAVMPVAPLVVARRVRVPARGGNALVARRPCRRRPPVHPGQPAELGQLLDEVVRLGHLAVSELGPGPLPRHVDVHGGQPEGSLQRALDAADAL